jgi:diphosphomevalonate decarboxylase
LKATAFAHPNIALVKYWGKRDEELVLPHHSSLSLTIGPFLVRTTVQFGAEGERVELNGRPAQGRERERVLETIRRVRGLAQLPLGGVRVASTGNFPTSAGLASSAAAFAALSVAARAAAGLSWDVRESSILARQGSGSACRSIQGGICLWRRGRRKDGTDSFAEQVFDAEHWPDLRLLAVVLEAGEKETSSREGMKRSVETSPFYPVWASDAEAEVPRAIERIRDRDLSGLGEIAERNAWRMHAVAISSEPALCYFAPATLALVSALAKERKGGLAAWFTLDAGPNPFILTDVRHQGEVERLARECGAREVTACKPGGDARLSEEHLF